MYALQNVIYNEKHFNHYIAFAILNNNNNLSLRSVESYIIPHSINCLFNGALNSSYITLHNFGRSVDNELERVWKETVVTDPGICLMGLRKTTKNTWVR
jgi:hypothetical protein